MIAGDAKVFWDELNMRHIIDKELEEVERRWEAKEITWNFKTVMSCIQPYPKRCEMYEWKPGMDDEATSDPDGVSYLPDAVAN